MLPRSLCAYSHDTKQIYTWKVSWVVRDINHGLIHWLRVISKIYRQWGSSWTDSFSHQFDEIRKPTDRRNRWWCPKLNNRGSKGQQRKKPSRQKLLGKARGHRVEGHQRSAPGLCRKSPVNIWKMVRFERALRNTAGTKEIYGFLQVWEILWLIPAHFASIHLTQEVKYVKRAKHKQFWLIFHSTEATEVFIKADIPALVQIAPHLNKGLLGTTRHKQKCIPGGFMARIQGHP